MRKLRQAQSLMRHRDVFPYLELKGLIDSRRPADRIRFRSLFERYYGLNYAHRDQAFKDMFFEVLHLARKPKHADVILELRRCSGRMEFSFTSKLVSMRVESEPIIDRHVLCFFQKNLPPTGSDAEERVKRYTDLLRYVKMSYILWARGGDVGIILHRLRRLDSRLSLCHDVRLLDFLVLKVGQENLDGEFGGQ